MISVFASDVRVGDALVFRLAGQSAHYIVLEKVQYSDSRIEFTLGWNTALVQIAADYDTHLMQVSELEFLRDEAENGHSSL